MNNQKDLEISPSSLEGMIRFLLNKVLKVSCQEVSVNLIDKQEITRLHQLYFQDPTPTDCISFPIDEIVLGEIFVCPEVAKIYAEPRGLCPYRETALYIVHGLLHLLGYDDITQEDRKKMRRKERHCLKKLDVEQWIQRLSL